MSGVSILILTLNEEINLPACIDSCAWSDDIVVFDSMSKDCTLQFAHLGAEIIRIESTHRLDATRRDGLITLVVVPLFVEKLGFCAVVFGIRTGPKLANRKRLVHRAGFTQEEHLGRPRTPAHRRCLLKFGGILERIRRYAAR